MLECFPAILFQYENFNILRINLRPFELAKGFDFWLPNYIFGDFSFKRIAITLTYQL